MERPRVLVTMAATVVPEETGIYPIVVVRELILQRLEELKITPLLIPGKSDHESINDLYHLADGIIFTGGHDIHPSFYNGDYQHPLTDARSEARDKMEIGLVRRAIEDQKPMLGLCRGAQIMAVATGGKLIQHLPDETAEDHGNPLVRKYDHDPKIISHRVKIVHGSRMHDIFKADSVDIPSIHHQGIKDPGDFVVTGRSDGGIIEIIEYSGHPFAIGIQGHGELYKRFKPLFMAFGQAVHGFALRRVYPLTS